MESPGKQALRLRFECGKFIGSAVQKDIESYGSRLRQREMGHEAILTAASALTQ